MIETSLFYGQYFSQFDMRAIATPGIAQSSESSQLLIGDNDVATAAAIKLKNIPFPGENDASANHAQRFLAWVKTYIRQGYPVIIGVYTAGGSATAYDHIVTVTKIESQYNDNNYYDGDLITIEDHGTGATLSSAKYLYTYSFKQFQGTRSQSSRSTSQDYFLASDTGCSAATDCANYGIVITGPIDNSSPPQLIPVRVDTSINNESPAITDGSNTRPSTSSVTLTVNVGNSNNPLTVGVSYTLYSYSSESKVPTSNFKANAANAATINVFTATGTTMVFTNTVVNSAKVIYRAVLS